MLPGSCYCKDMTHTSLLSKHAITPAAPSYPRLLAVYEPWFGHPRHINVGYSSQDPIEIRKQIDHAKQLGISGFVVDWLRRPRAFSRSQLRTGQFLGRKNFKVAMMYDESDGDAAAATDDALAAFDKFNQTYLAPNATSRQAYLAYNDRPVIFIFPKGGHTDWSRVRTAINRWNLIPLLIYENRPTPYTDSMDGFYACRRSWGKGLGCRRKQLGRRLLTRILSTHAIQVSEKIAVGAAWAGFDDSKASWSLNRHMSQRCGKTFSDTLELAEQNSSPDHPLPFVLIETWNDYEEGTAIERGIAEYEDEAQRRQ